MTQTCPACGQRASGRFCANCGSALSKVRCASCSNEIPAGGRFCNMCGTPAVPATAPAAPATRGTGSRTGAPAALPWIVAGVAVAALLALVLFPRGEQAPAPVPTAAAPVAGAVGDPTQVDLSSMTEREAADRLFDRVMRSVSAGDSAQARTFLPMALNAYEMVPELDLDGHYHVAVLHLVALDGQAARERAQLILDEAPNHIFGLFTAAQAEILLGNREAARALFQRLVDNYDAEVAQGRPEYQDHQPALAAVRTEAQAAAAR